MLLEKETLAFTYCQLPVKYHLSEEQKIVLHFHDGKEVLLRGHNMDPLHSAGIFNRSREIIQMDVWLSPGL